MSSLLPLFLKGKVVKGFGRGSKDLGCPTGALSLVRKVSVCGQHKCQMFSKQPNVFDKARLFLHLKATCTGGLSCPQRHGNLPQANYPLEVVQSLPKDLSPGVYYGWAQVDSQPVYKMVANIGWCPFYQNKQMSVETHIMQKFENDFYGSELKICVLGYLRSEKNFKSLEDLILAIKQDISNAEDKLDEPDAMKYKENIFFPKVD